MAETLENRMVETAARQQVMARWIPYATLTGAVCIFSLGAIFVRFAQAEHVPSLVIGTLRYSFAAMILAPYVLANHRPELRAISHRDLGFIAVAGCAFAIALFLFFSSLEHTTVMITNLFTNTSPLWVALAEALLLKALLDRRVWLGLILALLGGALFSLSGMDGSIRMGPDPVGGVLLSLASALLSTVYMILARVVRQRVPTLVFLWITMLSGSVLLYAIVLFSHTPLLGYAIEGYLWVLIVTITGQIIGQSLMAFTLAHLPATFVSVALLGQVIISGGLAFLIFGEQPDLVQVVAGTIILAGVVMVVTTRRAVGAR